MAAVKKMSTGGGKTPMRSTSGNAAHRPSKRSVAHRRLHLEPGHSALTEKIGENTGRKTQRASTDTQYRLSRVREFKSGTGNK